MRNWQRQVFLGALLVGVVWPACAGSPLTPHTEYNKRIRTGEMISPLTSYLFGEKVSPSSGATEFVVTDIDLPGSNALPVRLQRRLSISSFKDRQPLGGFGSWDIDVPFIEGTFESINKWNTGGNGTVSSPGSQTPDK